MKRHRRVYHLAEEAGLQPEHALSILREAGFLANTVNDQLALARVDAALLALKQIGIQLQVEQRQAKHADARQRNTCYLEAADILAIHNSLVDMFYREHDPIDPPGPRDIGLVESASHRPRTSLGSIEKYLTTLDKAGALFHSLVKNHAFHNGNKRTALVSLIVFLDYNGYLLGTTDDALFDFVVNTAAPHADAPTSDDQVNTISSWLREHTTKATDQAKGMRTSDFIDAVQKAGGRCRESGTRQAWIVWGLNQDSVNISKSTLRLTGSVVRTYITNLGLSHGQSGIYFGEFEEGLDPNRATIRRFRRVLMRLAKA